MFIIENFENPHMQKNPNQKDSNNKRKIEKKEKENYAER